ncbi:hypothetical protein VTJ04DRAFT_4579 [Mycothermus thermophilus]|uniref:uncharacterized protein n=1 Tax=Humicola insolens TaxID=85995 RepID=UPI003744654C
MATTTTTTAIKAPSVAPSSTLSTIASPKSDIRVVLDDHYASKVFTSLSPVSGHVCITTRRPVAFESIQIVLLGQTKTSFDGMSGPQEVTHTFLKMVMPVPDSAYPVPRLLEPGETYTVPFNFVIPAGLTINACNHERLADQVQQHHLLLPPSMGGRLAGEGWERDDMAPRMARVEYAIKARVLREDGDGRKIRVMEAARQLNVLPASVEEPPLSVSPSDRLYRMSATKTLRKSILSARLGTVTAEAVQPGPAVLSPDGRRVMTHPMAQIKLTFEPAIDSKTGGARPAIPPEVRSVTGKLEAHTFFASGTISSFPNLGEWHGPYELVRRGQYSTSVSLPPVNVAEQPAWTPVQELVRRDSGYAGSTSSQSDSNDRRRKKEKSHGQGQKYTTTLSVPISLPTDKKTFIPTFHSCIASRVYTLHLTVVLGGAGGEKKLTLVVPLQVAIASSPSPEQGQREGEEVAGEERTTEQNSTTSQREQQHDLPSFEEASADAHLRPRVLHAPPEWQVRLQEERMEQLRQTGRGGAALEGLVPAGVYTGIACR